MRHRWVLAAVCVTLVAVSCSTVGDTGSTSTTTSSSSPDSTTTIPASSTTTVSTTITTSEETETTTTSFEGAFAPPQPFVSPHPTATGGGSGCSPGPGPLPDGVWFGFINGMTDAAIDFDLACFVACDPGVGFTIRNDNPAGRTVEVADGAVVVLENPDGDDWLESYDAYRGYEEAALHNDVWIYVNDGVMTHIVDFAAIRGCRSAAVDVEWTVDLPAAARIAFNDLGLLAVDHEGGGENRFYWRSSDWTSWDPLSGEAHSGWQAWTVAGSADTVGLGATIHRWSGSSWHSTTVDTLGESVHVLGMTEDRVLMAGTSGGEAQVYVLTPIGDAWVPDIISLGSVNRWETWSGTISGSTFAVADTGIHSADGRGTVHIYDFDGTAWTRTATIRDPWVPGDWGGNWGSSLDLDGDILVVGADGVTPGSGTPGAVHAYRRTADGWGAELVGEGGAGFGYDARIDGTTIVAGASPGDPLVTFWIFVVVDGGWLGTPIRVPIDGDEEQDWLWGVDVDGDLVAVSTQSGLWIGRIIPVG